MNQKYLQGISSDMEGLEDAVFFEATPENISAFLVQHWLAEMSAIGTVDEKTFLTARMGLIDTCPDQEYLAQKLLPVYSKIQLGEIPTPPLETVPKEVRLRRNARGRIGTICAGMGTATRNIVGSSAAAHS